MRRMRSCSWLELVIEHQSCLWPPYERAGEDNEQGYDTEPQGYKFSRHGNHKAEIEKNTKKDRKRSYGGVAGMIGGSLFKSCILVQLENTTLFEGLVDYVEVRFYFLHLLSRNAKRIDFDKL